MPQRKRQTGISDQNILAHGHAYGQVCSRSQSSQGAHGRQQSGEGCGVRHHWHQVTLQSGKGYIGQLLQSEGGEEEWQVYPGHVD